MSRTAVWLLLLVAGCRHPFGPASDDDLVTNLRASPSAFDSFRRNAEIRYTLKSPEEVNVYILRHEEGGTEALVRVLARRLRETKGTHAITWLGDTDQRYFAPAGTYFAVIEAGGRRFETTVLVFHF